MAEKDEKSANEEKSLEAIKRKLNIGGYVRHMFLCTGPKCCTEEQGKECWSYLKERTIELGLRNGPVYVTKVGCLRICRDGPIGLVYPDGTWYKGLTKEALEKVIQSHLVKGEPVEDLSFAANPLPP